MKRKEKKRRVIAAICSLGWIIMVILFTASYTNAKDCATKEIEKQENIKSAESYNTTYADKVTVVLDYNGGFYNGSDKNVLEKYPSDSFGILAPKRENCVFSGWEIITGDATIELKNGNYIVTVGNSDSIIRAIWKTESGEDVIDTPTPMPQVTTGPVIEPTETPIQRTINVTVSLQGGTYYGESIVTKEVVERNTIILFENVDLIRREGYRVAGFTSDYGGVCKVLSDKKVMYTAPGYSDTRLDLINVIWEKIETVNTEVSASPLSQNTVYINLDGGKFESSNKSEDIYYVETNITKTLFHISDISKEGYALIGFEITDGVKYVIQGSSFILLPVGYMANGITIKALWGQDITSTPTTMPIITQEPVIITVAPTATPVIEEPVATQLVTEEPIIVSTGEPTAKSTVKPTIEPTAKSTVEPTIEPTAKPTSTPTTVTLTLNKNSIRIGKLEKIKLNAKTNSTETVKFKSGDTKIAIVDSNGTIIGKKVGTTTVTVEVANIKKKIKITVMLAPKKLGLNQSMKNTAKWTLKKGKKKQIALYFYTGTYSNSITFSSSRKKVATVSSTGLIKARKKGKATIKARTYNGKVVKITLVVK